MSKCPGIIQQLMDLVEDVDKVSSLQSENVPLYEQMCQHQLSALTDSTLSKSLDDIIKDFHAHLDDCSRCRNNPMGLCPVGAKLLQRVSHPSGIK